MYDIYAPVTYLPEAIRAGVLIVAHQYTYHLSVDGVDILDPSNPVVTTGVARSYSVVLTPASVNELWVNDRVPRGTLHRHEFRSSALSHTRDVYVYTPPDFEASGNRRYPVLYLIHSGGTNTQAYRWWLEHQAHMILDSLLAQGRVPPMLLVMPYNWTDPVFIDPRPNSHDAVQNWAVAARRTFLEEMVPFVISRYGRRMLHGRENTAVAGHSWGCGVTLSILAEHPGFAQFGGGMSCFAPFFIDPLKPLMAKQHTEGKPLPRYYLSMGEKDTDEFFKLNVAVAREFSDFLKRIDVQHELRTHDGGHGFGRGDLIRIMTNAFSTKKR